MRVTSTARTSGSRRLPVHRRRQLLHEPVHPERASTSSDRSDFYVPFTMNQLNPNQLFTRHLPLYRTDNAKAPTRRRQWHAISGDLTTGCTGTAPNGARTCAISAIGVGGGTAVYAGTLDGLVWVSPDAQTATTRPGRRSARQAQHAARTGRSRGSRSTAATTGSPTPPTTATTRRRRRRRATSSRRPTAGSRWTNISGDLPDAPVNSLVLDPSYPNTLYAATDVGPFVTYNGGAHWSPLGTGFPTVAVWQLDLDPLHRHHGGGHARPRRVPARRHDDRARRSSLSKVDAGVPVGPSSNLNYTITAPEHRQRRRRPASRSPTRCRTAHDFVSASNGGTVDKNGAGDVDGSERRAGRQHLGHVHRRASPARSRRRSTSITNDGVRATSAQGPFTTGSPVVTQIAPAYAMSVAPASQTDGGKAGTSVSYHVGVTNLGFTTDTLHARVGRRHLPGQLLRLRPARRRETTTPPVIAGATRRMSASRSRSRPRRSTATSARRR